MEATSNAAPQVDRGSEKLEPDASSDDDASNSKKKDRVAARDRNNGKKATRKANNINPFFTFLRHLASDAAKLAKTVLQLPMVTYPVWKWFILVYIGWLCLSYTIVYAVYRGEEALAATVCPIPMVGSQFEFCHATTASEPPTPFNVGKVATAQDELAAP
ncbi:hypothetical protein C8A01DRAFT_34394 [Parachaetomium inaequale]|uniref:Uncharacterized protein n=1 Tax=Parachaetomium inaequale TaxID=2588326 RepID=A0AAN6SSK1_9PEZI|nr:hypothetical protein C8A01DRAFT_34394 [Parachaetomium inaequale]